MATFQIHEDVENYFPKNQCRIPIPITKNSLNTVTNGVACNGKENIRHVLKPITRNVCNNEQRCNIIDDSICVVEQTEKVRNSQLDGRKKLLEVIDTSDNFNIKELAVIREDDLDFEPSCLDSAVVKVGKHGSELIECDEKDGFPLSLSEVDEYRHDIWVYHMQTERERDDGPSAAPPAHPDYMRRQPELTWSMRAVLVDWLAAVAVEYRLHADTLHLAVGYVDRFLRRVSVVRDKFQLVGAAAMMVAAKVEEIYPPDSTEWAYLTGDAYTVRQLLKMEQLVLRTLRFRLQPPTQLTFVRHLCTELRLDDRTMHLAMYVTELVLLEGEDYVGQLPSVLAAAAVAYARHTLEKRRPWPEAMRAASGYTLRQLSPVVRRQHRTFRDSPLKDTQAIQTKYKADKYHRVALLKPRALDLDDLADC